MAAGLLKPCISSLLIIIPCSRCHNPMTQMTVFGLREEINCPRLPRHQVGETGCKQRSTRIQSPRLNCQHYVISTLFSQSMGSRWAEGLCMDSMRLTWLLLTTDLSSALVTLPMPRSLVPTPHLCPRVSSSLAAMPCSTLYVRLWLPRPALPGQVRARLRSRQNLRDA